MEYIDAIDAAWDGARIRMPYWNDESYLGLHKDKILMHLGGRWTDCGPTGHEILSDQWEVLPDNTVSTTGEKS